MDLCFGQVSRSVAPYSNVDELWAVIVREIPGLEPHRHHIHMRYIDDEGDEILVTTTDELQEAHRAGKETSRGLLVLNLIVPGMDAITQTAIEATASRKVSQETSSLASSCVEIPTATKPDVDVLQILKDAGASAVAEINSALGSASTEIEKLFGQLDTASTKQKETIKQLAAVKAELAEANSKCIAGVHKVSHLEARLKAANELLVKSTVQKNMDEARLHSLEIQVAETAKWENKCKVAEEQRLCLSQQLQSLRSGLQLLTGSKSIAATAEVVSTEVMPPSPVINSVPSPELPPPYEEPTVEEPTVGVPVANYNVFPVDCPSPSPLELNMQQLQAMGFNLTFEQLREKLVEHSGNMQHVINSLL